MEELQKVENSITSASAVPPPLPPPPLLPLLPLLAPPLPPPPPFPPSPPPSLLSLSPLLPCASGPYFLPAPFDGDAGVCSCLSGAEASLKRACADACRIARGRFSGAASSFSSESVTLGMRSIRTSTYARQQSRRSELWQGGSSAR
eukprot:3320909-Pleurochrysis_carterae.AAC.2